MNYKERRELEEKEYNDLMIRYGSGGYVGQEKLALNAELEDSLKHHPFDQVLDYFSIQSEDQSEGDGDYGALF